MSNRKQYRSRSFHDASQPVLAVGSNGNGYGRGAPPGGRARLASGMPPPDPSLTVKFNRASKGIVLNDKSKDAIQLKIDALRREMSKTANTYEMSPLGTIHSSIASNRDKWLSKTITALQQLQKGNDNQQQTGKSPKPQQRLGLDGNQGLAKQQFNQAAQGKGK